MTARFPFADRVRAVLFDVGNTLMWLDHARMAAIVGSAGIACDAASVRRAEMRARPRLDDALRAARGSETDAIRSRYATLVVEELTAAGAASAPVPPSAATAAAVTSVTSRAVADLLAVWGALWSCPPDDAAPTLDALAARGLVLGCVSNADGRVRERLAGVGLAERVACVVDSGVEGIEKPDPRIFLRAAERLRVPAAACVYVGDFLALDVEGARAAGMEGVLLDPIGAWGDRGVPRVACLAEVPARLGA